MERATKCELKQEYLMSKLKKCHSGGAQRPLKSQEALTCKLLRLPRRASSPRNCFLDIKTTQNDAFLLARHRNAT